MSGSGRKPKDLIILPALVLDLVSTHTDSIYPRIVFMVEVIGEEADVSHLGIESIHRILDIQSCGQGIP